MAWACWTLLVLNFINLVLGVAFHGIKRDPHNGWMNTVAGLVGMILLWFAGALPGSPY